MPTMKASRAKFALGILGLLVAVLACQRFGGRTVVVEFRSAEGIESGLAVSSAGTQIGITRKTTIVGGRAQVSVQLHRDHNDALPTSAVFVLAKDSENPEKNRLVVYDMTAVSPDLESGPERYQGFRSVVELALVVGAEKAQKIWENVSQLQLDPDAWRPGNTD